MSRHNLFFTPDQETDDFRSVLQKVQEHITGQHSELLSDGNATEAKANIKRYIAKFVQDSRVAVKGMTQQQLVDALYTEMAEYSFLTKYIFADGIEEIDSATRS